MKRGLNKHSFPRDDWGDVSKNCLDFIKKLLVHDPSKRMTAAKALKHPWLTKEASTKPLCTKRDMAKRLGKFVGATKLRKVALNVLAHHLTEKEASELSLVWKDLAKTKKGALTFDDMKRTLRTHHGGTELELDELVRSLDVNGDHLIDYYEFSAAMLARNRTIRDDRLVEVFREMDRDGTGDVSLQNLEEIMGSRAHAEEVLGELAGNAEFRRTGKLTLAALKEQLAKVGPGRLPPSMSLEDA